MLFEPRLRNNLKIIATRYAKKRGHQISTVAREFCGDHQFFDRIIDQGKTFSVLQYDRIIARFALNWPEDLKWPADVPRPSAAEIEIVRHRAPSTRSKPWS
jgi:hypothetical protein